MSDETVIIHKTPPTFAYLFWANGIRRGDHAMLRADGNTIGRSASSEILLDDPTVSDEHARIRFESGKWFVYDLASSNSVLVAGEAVHRRALEDGDRLKIGLTEFVFRHVR
jgi:pSer/pThr/pTyr-binding forkhead associated (FHA) protein